MTLTLKGGHITQDPRLDRLVQFDERSRRFGLFQAIPEPRLRSMTWKCESWLDQGHQGACTGFSWSHELAALPAKVDVSNEMAVSIYKAAQKVDEWPGEDYEGSSVLAAAKIVQGLGYIEKYSWAFGVDEAVLALGHGPTVNGIHWLTSMFDPRPSGLLEVSQNINDIAGGHAIMARGVTLVPHLAGETLTEPVIRFRNSWGKGWGLNGDCFMKLSDYDWLLKNDGECCFAVNRHSKPVVDKMSMQEVAG